MLNNFKVKTVLIAALFLISPIIVSAATLGETKSFFLDPSYDISGRKEISVVLQKVTSQLYFYIDNSFWQGLSFDDKNKINSALQSLADEFERKIYPTLISTFGLEWKPGIDKDEHITILIHPMKKNRAGYFNSGNEYSKVLVPASNEREMVYLNSDYIASSINKSFLAHEFMHLITFNQKERIQGVEDEVWLNEARADYAPTLLGYDSEYQGSNLQRRVIEFLRDPSDSITEWNNSSADYGSLNLFTQYLVDYYGVNILSDSLHSPKKGIESINYALTKNGFRENFSQIFTNWTIAVLVNDCSLGVKYCYKNENLRNLRVVPVSNFLPINLQSTLSVNYITKSWTGNWHKIFGGGGTLIFDFDGVSSGNFRLPYVICDSLNVCSVNFLSLDKNQDGNLVIKGFHTEYSSLIVIPSAQSNNSSSIPFFWEAKVNLGNLEEEELINQLLNKIDSLKAEIARVQAQIASTSGKTSYCSELKSDLYFGLKDNQEVRCLQEFLKNQGPDIYPEGLITGNFLSLTKAAVIRFQEKYVSEILKPLKLERGTGYAGAKTIAKINELLSKPR